MIVFESLPVTVSCYVYCMAMRPPCQEYSCGARIAMKMEGFAVGRTAYDRAKLLNRCNFLPNAETIPNRGGSD